MGGRGKMPLDFEKNFSNSNFFDLSIFQQNLFFKNCSFEANFIPSNLQLDLWFVLKTRPIKAIQTNGYSTIFN